MTRNMERRKAVMARSIALGHCVCNPRNPCPCDLFRAHNVCPCAGERLLSPTRVVRLTKHITKPGCSSKIGQADLRRVLEHLPEVKDPNVLLGSSAGDDAGVYKISSDTALVQTVDVFSPIVDDPHTFGRIAAANSLSDVYAMGAKALTALSIVGFPIDELDGSALAEMLAGGAEVLEQAGCALIGGHSINDPEPKMGFAVTGVVHPDSAVLRGAARDGDLLVLTKPLGTGIVAFADQISRVSDADLAEITASMVRLNRKASELMVAHRAHACTDVTGFGLAGHLIEMARVSGLVAEIGLENLPIFDAARKCLADQIYSGAVERNEEYSMAWVLTHDDVSRSVLPIIYDAQTSGGLLIALPPDRASAFMDDLREAGEPEAFVIGYVRKRQQDDNSICLIVASSLISKESRVCDNSKAKLAATDSEGGMDSPCCPEHGPTIETSGLSAKRDHANGVFEESSQGARALDLFAKYMAEANREGQVCTRAKRLVAVALSIATRCRPCLVHHMKGALDLGTPHDMIHEVAALAIAFGGCPSYTLYREVCKELDVK